MTKRKYVEDRQHVRVSEEHYMAVHRAARAVNMSVTSLMAVLVNRFADDFVRAHGKDPEDLEKVDPYQPIPRSGGWRRVGIKSVLLQVEVGKDAALLLRKMCHLLDRNKRYVLERMIDMYLPALVAEFRRIGEAEAERIIWPRGRGER